MKRRNKIFKTHFSFRKATGSPEEVVSKLKELGYKYAPIADIETTFGFSEWRAACEKHSLKPIYGVQLAVTESLTAKKPAIDYFTFYAKDNLKDLNDVIEMAYKQGRSLPRLGFRPLLKYSDLHTDAFSRLIVVAGRKAQLHLLQEGYLGYIGVSPATSRGFVSMALQQGLKFFASQEQFFVEESDNQFYEVHCGINAELKTYPQYIMEHGRWFEETSIEIDTSSLNIDLQKAWEVMEDEFEECTADILPGDLLRPISEKSLQELCFEGAKEKGVDLDDPVYKERLEMELKVIQDKKFDDYFFIVADLVHWAKDHMMVGPGRGSSAGSLVCYLLDITDVDPIKYGLLFFRFLDPSRPDWPDIDQDFSDRDAVVEYLVNKYGNDRVAKIGTINNFKVDNTVNEVCKSLLLPRFEFEPLVKEVDKLNLTANDKRWKTVLAEMIEENEIGKRLVSKYPEFEVAKRMSATPANGGTHASGVIVSNVPITQSFAINPETQTAMAVASDMEGVGFIKLDALGLINLSVISATMRMAGITRDDLRKIDLEDEKVFKVMNEGRYKNIFQYEGEGVSKLARTVTVDSFNDYIAISSFARPGPLQSGSAERWTQKKNGLIPVSYMHPLFEPYFRDTLGEMAYQEQIMLVAHDIAGLDWGIVSKMRKAIAKSMGAEALREFGDPFKQGLVKAGVSEDVADKFWNDILGCGAYLFNKSHAAAYGLISYWTCYLKAYYPLEFACAALTASGSTDKQLAVLREMRDEGVDYVPYDLEHSTNEWRVVTKNDKKILVGPLSNVDGVGPKTVNQILACRARNEPLPESIQKKLSKAKSTFSTLTPVSDWREENNARSHVIQDFTDCANAKPNGEWQENVYICGVCDKIEEHDENEERRVQDRIARGQPGLKTGQTKFVELRVRDDTDTVYAKIGMYDYEKWGKQILEEGREKKTMVVIKGTVCPEAPVLLVKGFRIIGEL